MATGVQELADAQEGPAAQPEGGAELSVEQALELIPGMSRRRLLELTRGKPFRRDYNRQVKTFDRAGFERWRSLHWGRR